VKVRRRDVGVMVKHIGIVAIFVALGRELDLGEIQLVWPLRENDVCGKRSGG